MLGKPRSAYKRRAHFALGIAAGVVLSLGAPPGAQAATIKVTKGAVDAVTNGNCSIREAITAANTDSAVDACTAGSGADTINAPGAFVLRTPDNDANGLPVIASSVRINNASLTRASGAPPLRILEVESTGDLTLHNVTVSHGLARDCPTSEDVCGGGIANEGTLAVHNSRIVNNTATGTTFGVEGGGIYNAGTASLASSELSANSASNTSSDFNGALGGGIHNEGTLNVQSSRLSDNTASCSGGGPSGCFALGGSIYNPDPGKLNVQSSRLSENTTSCSATGCFAVGGAVTNDATATVRSSHISDNTASCSASECTAIGGGAGTGFGTLDLRSNQVRNNTASCSASGCVARGGGLDNDFDGTLNVENSRLAGNEAIAPSGIARGGGLYNGSGTTTVARSGVTGNLASGATAEGGGIYEGGGSVVLIKSRVSGNTPDDCRPVASVPGCSD
ncbi:MAG: hypothetical protein M3217_00010 [Actinomycetota bacterium]|nr:hypothetical protein [Actinomycetota bacterium]